MQNRRTFAVGLALAALSSGCAGYGPNTQQGAVGGAAAGAILGGILGNNSRHGDTLSGAAVGAVAGGLAGGAIGNSLDHQRGTLYAQPQNEYVVAQPPPPPAPRREVVAVRPAREAVWIEGYWTYTGRGDRYEWFPGTGKCHRRSAGFLFVRAGSLGQTATFTCAAIGADSGRPRAVIHSYRTYGV